MKIDLTETPKIELDHVPAKFLFELELFMGYAARKHGRHGWKEPYQKDEWLEKAEGHYEKWQDGYEYDDDSGFPHLMNTIVRLIQLYDMEYLDNG